jgi:hypothetical protein
MEIERVTPVDTREAYVSLIAIVVLALMTPSSVSWIGEKHPSVRSMSLAVHCLCFNSFVFPSSSAIVQEIEGRCVAGLATMAYYYFDFRDVKKQNLYGLLSSLLSQLSAESDSCHELLSRLYSLNAGGTRKPTSFAMTVCIKDMLGLPGQGPVYIVVDALDECPKTTGTPSAREEVLNLVEEIVGLGLPNVYLCVTSRPEIDIRTVLNPLKPLQISLHDENGQKQDMIEYLKWVVHSDREMRRWRGEDQKLVIDTLSEKADGM